MSNWKDNFPKKNRYYETENGILYCGDALEIIKKFSENSIDLILTDPPYNIADKSKITFSRKNIVNNYEAWGKSFKDKWDNYEDYVKWIMNFINIYYSILKEEGNLILFLDRKYTGYFSILIEEIKFLYKNKIYFEKLNPLPSIRKNNYRSTIEEAIWFAKSNKYKFNFISQQKMKQIFKGNIGNKETKHPTEKYFWMINPLIDRHSYKNDIVLDTFAGSGTILIAAEKLNRRWIGIEINQEYCKMIKDRLISNFSNYKLF